MGWGFRISDGRVYASFNGGELWNDREVYLQKILSENSGFNFHGSWGRLMPVVEKIETGMNWPYCVQLERNMFAEKSSSDLYRCVIHDEGYATQIIVSHNNKIMGCFTAVVEFIKWINLSKLNE